MAHDPTDKSGIISFLHPSTVELPAGATDIAVVEHEEKAMLQWTEMRVVAMRAPKPAALVPVRARLRWNPLRVVLGWLRWLSRGRAPELGRWGQCDCQRGDYCPGYPFAHRRRS